MDQMKMSDLLREREYADCCLCSERHEVIKVGPLKVMACPEVPPNSLWSYPASRALARDVQERAQWIR